MNTSDISSTKDFRVIYRPRPISEFETSRLAELIVDGISDTEVQIGEETYQFDRVLDSGTDQEETFNSVMGQY
jgi:hypothetical protein